MPFIKENDNNLIYTSITNKNIKTQIKSFDNLQIIKYPSVNILVEDKDVVYIGSDEKYYRAIADGTEKENVVGIYDAANNRIITCGIVDIGINIPIGNKVYLSKTEAGKVQLDPSDVTLGISLGNGYILFNPDKLNSNFVKTDDLTVINLPNNGHTTVWEKIGELRGGDEYTGAELFFTIYGSGRLSHTGRQTLFVNAQQRDENGIQVDVYFLENGNVDNDTINVGYIQVGTYDFDIYIKRHYYNPCIIVAPNNSFNGTIIKNPTTLSSEPSGIVYIIKNRIWHSGNDGVGSGLNADLLRGLPADFACSKTENGYTKLPNGLIIQWGSDSVGIKSTKTVNFPISFPNACQSVVSIPVGHSSGGGDIDYWGVYNVTESEFTQSNQYDGPHDFYWIAIGY